MKNCHKCLGLGKVYGFGIIKGGIRYGGFFDDCEECKGTGRVQIGKRTFESR